MSLPPIPPASGPQRRFPEVSGSRLFLFVFLPLLLVVGGAFVLLTPHLTQKQSGSLYLGVRFDDERTMAFLRRNGGNPTVTLEIYPQGAPESPVARFEGIPRGKSIIPVLLPDGPYHLVFSAPEYQTLRFQMEMIDGDFHPAPSAELPAGSASQEQFIGVMMLAEVDPPAST